MKYKITNLEYGIGPWGTEMLYGGIGNPHPGETEDNVHSVTLLEGENGKKILVDTERGKVIVGGDIACRPANIYGTDEWPGFLVPVLGRSGSARMVCGAYEWIREATEGDASRLVLTHDVTMHDRFETEGRPGLAIHYIAK